MPKEKPLNSKSTAGARCDLCWGRDLIRRHIHFLKLGAGSVGHLREQYGEEITGLINCILDWKRSIESMYGGRVDDLGCPIPAWKAWILAHKGELRRYEN